MKRKTVLLLAVVVLWWTLNSLAVGTQWMLMEDATGKGVAFWRAMPPSMVGAWGWIPIALSLFWLAARFPIETGRILPRLGLHAGAVLLVIGFRAVYIYSLDPWLHWYEVAPDFPDVLVQSVWNNFFQAWLVIGVGHALVFSDRAREREAQASRLQSQLAEARLEALASRLNPHFLFNALNSIAELVHRDADAADRMIIGLSALLRSSLEQAAHAEVPLDEELRLLGHYLDIEKIRLGERLRVEWAIAEDTREALVPPLLLQPLVENAVRHGIEPAAEGGQVLITARVRRGQAEVLVSNTLGAEPGTPANPGHGMALDNVRERLRLLHDVAAECTVSQSGGMFHARVVLPLP